MSEPGCNSSSAQPSNTIRFISPTMMQIVSDAAQPGLIIVNLDAQGHDLSVRLDRAMLEHTLGVHGAFASLAQAVGRNIERIQDAALRKYQQTRQRCVILSKAELMRVAG